jgi:hypothetical protein
MDGIVLTKWLSGAEMSSDLFTKNLAQPLFKQHAKTYCGQDQYMKKKSLETLKGRVLLEGEIESLPGHVTSKHVISDKYVSHKNPLLWDPL